ncbi:dipeptide ABC transporter ATP-binding protein [Agrococcus sp. DT81.2]|uniref:dipeptide ABC transporter ATP-binding protein n=1 Tax=Agrococcus sp. DT81.2 TaxID=3393414 RepID=UPI003CE48CC1
MSDAKKPLLEVSGLKVEFTTQDGVVTAVHEADITLGAGETLAIVGESGSGKSTTAMAIIGLLSGNGRITAGSVRLDGEELVGANETAMRKVRGRRIGLVPQDPMSNLNPVARIGSQVAETLLAHGLADRRNVDAKVVETLEAAGLPNAAERAKQYPHEFSGGMRQRALIAIGLACRPQLLIADEPTSALDVTVQRTILDQLDTMTKELGTAVLLITHDLGLAAERAQRVVVMHRGRVVEQGPAKQILESPQHPYTQSLVAAAPSVAMARLRPEDFALTEGRPTVSVPRNASDIIVEFENVRKEFHVRGRREPFVAVDDISLKVPRGTTVSIVGESGSGKTTAARMLLKAFEPTSGTVRFEGKDVFSLSREEQKSFRQRVQPVFQDPYSSLNPMFTIERIIDEPLSFYNKGSKAERQRRVRELLDQVALPTDMARRYPSELSGGQRQRVAIARALALSPDVIVCDEPVSALDVLVQDQILRLLGDLQRDLGLSYLFISHDLAVVRLISDYVAVMQNGRLVEAATSEEIFTNPRDPYTRRLLASIPGNELKIAS